MANRIAIGNGNWLTAGTWGAAEAGTGAAQLTRSASTNTTTSYVWSSAFTCTNADVLDGLLLHVKGTGATGTITVGLSADNGSSAAREVTINASDLPTDQCWFFFKFDSTLTADGGSDYKVGVKMSAGASAMTVYRDGTAGNWARLVRTTATGAPGAGDNLFIAGEWTAAGTTTARAVTMDALEASITDHGTLDIGRGGTLSFGTAASTAYYLRLSGDLNVWSGGTLNMGTVGAEIPGTSTAKLNLDCGSNVQYGLIVNFGGTFVAQGASKTTWTYLAADAAVNATSLTTADSTGWADNDEIAVASTTRTYTQCEKGTLNGAASGTGVTVDGFGGAGGGLANAHSGTVPTRAEIINLTRNVQVFGASASLQTYIYIATTAAVDWDYAEFFWCGSNTPAKRGIDIATTTGTCSIQYCSLHDFAVAGSVGAWVAGLTASNNTFSGNVGFGFALYGYCQSSATSGTWTCTDNILMLTLSTAGGSLYYFNDAGGTLERNIAVGAKATGFLCSEAAIPVSNSTNTAHSCGSAGFELSVAPGTGLSDLTAYRNAGVGVSIENQTSRVTISGASLFGNAPTNLSFSTNVSGLRLTGLTINSDGSFATANGIVFSGWVVESILENSVVGGAAAHTTDIVFSQSMASVKCNAVTLGSPTPFTALAAKLAGSAVHFQRYGQTPGDHRTFYPHGTISSDSTAGMFHTAAPSARQTPASASVKLESAGARKAVNSGATATFSVWVRKSAAGDGAAYNGAQPRLMVRANPALGLNADATLDTATSASDGDWEQLTGTTAAAIGDDGVFEAFVDCDGTAGWVNVDDWTSA